MRTSYLMVRSPYLGLNPFIDPLVEGADDPVALNQQRNKKALEAIRRVRDKLTGRPGLFTTSHLISSIFVRQ